MIRLDTPLLTLLAALLLMPPALAEGRKPDFPQKEIGDWAPELSGEGPQEFRVIPLRRAAQIAAKRFRGRLIAARLTGPAPHERARGVILVHELRLLTPNRDVLRIRLDARTGDFLEVAGAGLTKARRKGGGKEDRE